MWCIVTVVELVSGKVTIFRGRRAFHRYVLETETGAFPIVHVNVEYEKDPGEGAYVCLSFSDWIAAVRAKPEFSYTSFKWEANAYFNANHFLMREWFPLKIDLVIKKVYNLMSLEEQCMRMPFF